MKKAKSPVPAWAPKLGEVCWFTKSMRMVKVVELADPKRKHYPGYTVERIDSGKQLYVELDGLAPKDAHVAAD